jgi:hypothetical protein
MNRRQFLGRILGVTAMTTTYHDAIATGAPANASTFNNPLDDLDQAIVSLQGEVTDLVIGSGTSPAETIAARGGYASLDGRLDDIYLRYNTLLVDANFAVTNAAERRFKTISLALAACTGGETILIAPGRYVENAGFGANNITLLGSGQPEWTGSGLAGGTIIQGYMNLFATIGATVRDLGLDCSGVASGTNGIGSTAATENTYRVFMNLTIWGNGDAGLAHGIYGSGHHNLYHNIKCIDWYTGIAIHGSYAVINGYYAYRCTGFSLVIKGKSGINVEHVNVSNVVLEGDTSSGNTYLAAPLDIQTANSCITRYVHLNNISFLNGKQAALYIHQGDATGTISDISVTNMTSVNQKDLPLQGDFAIRYGSRITLTNCRSIARQSLVFGFTQIAPADVSLFACSADVSGGGQVSGAFNVLDLNGNETRAGTLAVTGAMSTSATMTATGGFRCVSAVINDDTVLDIPVALTQGFLMVAPNGGSNVNSRFFFGVIRAASGPVIAQLNIGSEVTAAAVALSGTTGTDVKLNIGVVSGHIYVENRLGAAQGFSVTFFA